MRIVNVNILESIYLSIKPMYPDYQVRRSLHNYTFLFHEVTQSSDKYFIFASKMYTLITKYRKKNQLLMFLAILLNARVKQHDMPIIRVLMKKSVFIH